MVRFVLLVYQCARGACCMRLYRNIRQLVMFCSIRWISEKFDGIRAVWSSEQRSFFSRFGNEIQVLAWVDKIMPSVWLDGEFW